MRTILTIERSGAHEELGARLANCGGADPDPAHPHRWRHCIDADTVAMDRAVSALCLWLWLVGALALLDRDEADRVTVAEVVTYALWPIAMPARYARNAWRS